MYLLDTNVLSELMRAAPSPAVLDWMNGQTPHKLFISAVARAEIELGIALLPTGKRKTNLATQAKAMFDEDFAGRCLPFDASSASLYAAVVAARTRQGLPISVEDAQIAAISLSHQKTLVTRNTVDFEKVQGLSLVNPW
jgi:toxin FitB